MKALKKSDVARVRRYVQRERQLAKLRAQQDADNEFLKGRYEDGLFSGHGYEIDLAETKTRMPNWGKLKASKVWLQYSVMVTSRRLKARKTKGSK